MENVTHPDPNAARHACTFGASLVRCGNANCTTKRCYLLYLVSACTDESNFAHDLLKCSSGLANDTHRWPCVPVLFTQIHDPRRTLPILYLYSTLYYAYYVCNVVQLCSHSENAQPAIYLFSTYNFGLSRSPRASHMQ